MEESKIYWEFKKLIQERVVNSFFIILTIHSYNIIDSIILKYR